MTVTDVVDTRHTYKRGEQPEYNVVCTWFEADGNVRKQCFPGDALVKQ
jgi:uncharacterized protein YodC (DUF2158 family)